MKLDYSTIEVQLVEQLPELRPAVERYWHEEGAPGDDAGPYILFEDLFRPYVDMLLAAQPSETRDYLLRRAFAFTEECIRAGGDLHDLAAIAVFESQCNTWFERAEPYIGIQSRHEANIYEWPVNDSIVADTRTDLYGVSALVRTLLSTKHPSHGAT